LHSVSSPKPVLDIVKIGIFGNPETEVGSARLTRVKSSLLTVHHPLPSVGYSVHCTIDTGPVYRDTSSCTSIQYGDPVRQRRKAEGVVDGYIK